jgi:hypothetical protein
MNDTYAREQTSNTRTVAPVLLAYYEPTQNKAKSKQQEQNKAN